MTRLVVGIAAKPHGNDSHESIVRFASHYDAPVANPKAEFTEPPSQSANIAGTISFELPDCRIDATGLS